jgi:hypothetical protein
MGIRWWPPSNAERLFHLATLLDAITLYDAVYVLKAELPPDAPLLRLREFLTTSGIVVPIDTKAIAEPISAEFREFLASVTPQHSEVYPIREKLTEEIATVVSCSLQGMPVSKSHATPSPHFGADDYDAETVADGLVKEYEGTVSHWWLELQSKRLAENSIATLGGHLLDEIGYFGSGAVVDGVSHLRTFVYWRISDHLAIPFLPSCRRSPQFEAISRQLSPTVHQEVFQVIAAAFKTTVEHAYQDGLPTAIPIPPITSLFLNKMRKQKDFTACIVDIRDEFKGLREAMRRLQSELRGATTIRQRLDAKKILKELLHGLKKHYETCDDAVLDETLGYAPDVLRPLANPSSQETYTANLAKKPLEWIRSWWLKRPFRLAYKLRDRLTSIAAYHDLLPETLGVDIGSEESTEFQELYKQCMSLYGCK